jgi:murein DD-endopeptidase MepM/ murein hydrolase activator NlpD
MHCKIDIILRVLVACLFLLASAAFAENPYPFKAKLEKRDGLIVAVAYNDGPATVTAIVNVSSRNCSVDASANTRKVVRARESLIVSEIRAPSKGTGCQAALNYKYQMGDFSRAMDGEPFRVPFDDNRAHRVGQAFGGPLTTHNSPESQYALDIDMPQGTKIVAAKEGIVVDFAFTHTNAGSINDSKNLNANFVLLEHTDGTLTIYSHLAPRPVALVLGNKVNAGALIGYSGNTGYSSGPHLHFAVLKPRFKEDGALVSKAMPFNFYSGTKRNIFVPRKGMMLAN